MKIKKKDLPVLSKTNRAEIHNALTCIFDSSSDAAVREKLSDMIEKVRNMPERSTSPMLPDTDAAIKQIIEQLSTDISAGRQLSAQSRMEKLRYYINKRSKYCPSPKLAMSKADQKEWERAQKIEAKLNKKRERARIKGKNAVNLYSPEELLDNMLMSTIDEVAEEEKKKLDLHARLIKNPNDAYALSMWQPCLIRLKTAQNRLNMCSDGMTRQAMITGVGSLDETQKQLIINGAPTDEAFNVVMQKYGEIENTQQHNADMTRNAFERYINGSVSASAEAAAIQTVQSAEIVRNVGSAAATPTISSGVSDKAKAIFNSPEFLALGGMPDAREQAVKQSYDRVEQIIGTINKSDGKLADELEKQNEKRRDLAAQLKGLLTRRKTASPSECWSLDSDIDVLRSQFNDVKTTIDLLAQSRAQIAETRSIYGKVESIKTVGKINEAIAALTGNKIETLEALALDVNQKIENANTALERASQANMVAGGTTINTRTQNGTMQDMVNEAAGKDEHKYDDLEKELGMK